MDLEFPYQIVTFLEHEPESLEPVYYGKHGWYPQLALKRRFKLNGLTEEDFLSQLQEFFEERSPISISTGGLVQPAQMPVQVVEVVNQDGLKDLHKHFITTFEHTIISRYPEREGENYYPHITAEYNHRFVIPVDEYTHKTFSPSNIWLLKDVNDENSLAFAKIK